MVVGILTYYSVCNFGANLQALSTFQYFKNNRHEPILINWLPDYLDKKYKGLVPEEQYECHRKFCEKHFVTTKLCHSAQEIANEIKRLNISCVVVGSDAVAQHHTLKSRIVFPTSRVFSIVPANEDTTCPNPFWGTFNDYLEQPVPIAMMSVSNQNSNYRQMPKSEQKIMATYASQLKFVTTRDKRTADMFSMVTKGQIVPPVTPDPVFAFNYNVKNQIAEAEIRRKYHLNGNYILLCFHHTRNIDYNWLVKFKAEAAKYGYECVAFPIPEGIKFEHPFDNKIELPLDPLEWYALIKYSSGYVGCNMHPIVVSLHNTVPCCSFDNYGVSHLRIFIDDKSSKIYQILNSFGVIDNRFRSRGLFLDKPSPEHVLNQLIYFDKKHVREKSVEYLEAYKQMMKKIDQNLSLTD